MKPDNRKDSITQGSSKDSSYLKIEGDSVSFPKRYRTHSIADNILDRSSLIITASVSYLVLSLVLLAIPWILHVVNQALSTGNLSGIAFYFTVLSLIITLVSFCVIVPFCLVFMISDLILLRKLIQSTADWKCIVITSKDLELHDDSFGAHINLPWKSINYIDIVNKSFPDERSEDVLRIKTKKEKTWLIPMHGIDQSERIHLHELLNEKLTEDKLEIDTLVPEEKKRSYTEIWLDYFNADVECKRIEQLTEETILAKRYKIIEKMVTGGQGTTYLAIDLKDREEDRDNAPYVVLKEYVLPLHARVSNRMEIAKQLHLELDLLAKMDHPLVMKCNEIFVENFNAYVVLEHQVGKTLREVIEEEGPLEIKRAVELGLKLTEILEYLHSLTPPVIHRDFTPDNIIIGTDDTPKLIDFSIAQELTDEKTGLVAGRPGYVPEEQLKGRATLRSDIYGFGCTFSFMLTGEDPPPLTEIDLSKSDNNFGADLNLLVSCATKQDPDHRYMSIKNLASDLKNLSL